MTGPTRNVGEMTGNRRWMNNDDDDWGMNTTLATKLPQRAPVAGELVQVRSRRWLVEEVVPPETAGESSLIQLACADDDAQGQSLASSGTTSSTGRSSRTKVGPTSPPRASTRRASSRPSFTRCAGTTSPRPIRASSRRRSGPESASTPTRWSRFANPTSPTQRQKGDRPLIFRS